MSDDTLILAIKNHFADEKRSCFLGMEALCEALRRELHLVKGKSSMRAFCMEEFGMSESVAGKRIQVARLCLRFPLALQLLKEDKVHLSALGLICPHITEENAEGLLEAICGKSEDAVKRILATFFPSKKLPQDKVTWLRAG